MIEQTRKVFCRLLFTVRSIKAGKRFTEKYICMPLAWEHLQDILLLNAQCFICLTIVIQHGAQSIFASFPSASADTKAKTFLNL